jgi:hypothetical protein
MVSDQLMEKRLKNIENMKEKERLEFKEVQKT